MKSFILAFIIFCINISFCFGQSKYLGMSKNKILKLLSIEKIDVFESDKDMIHAVDDKTLCNLIFYFDEKKICYHLKTTFQEETGFLKLANFYQVYFNGIDETKWAFPLKNGIDSIKISREYGFDLIEETYYE